MEGVLSPVPGLPDVAGGLFSFVFVLSNLAFSARMWGTRSFIESDRDNDDQTIRLGDPKTDMPSPTADFKVYGMDGGHRPLL